MKMAVVQLIKGALDTAEERILKRVREYVMFHRVGEGDPWDRQERDRDALCAQEG